MVVDSQASKALHPPLMIILPSITQIHAAEGSARCKLSRGKSKDSEDDGPCAVRKSHTTCMAISTFPLTYPSAAVAHLGGPIIASRLWLDFNDGTIRLVPRKLAESRTIDAPTVISRLGPRNQGKKKRPWRKGCTPECANAFLAGPSANPLTAESRHLAVCLGKMTFI